MKTVIKEIPLLLVDDEPGIRKVLSISLVDSGFSVTSAKDGQEALALIEDRPAWIVLTDIKMPGVSGIDLLKSIKRMQPDSEVIMITGHGDMELAIQSLKFGAIDFITKPIDETLLEMALRRAGERMTMRAQLETYTRQLEQMVEEKSRQLINAERMAAIGETVAGLSHAIKNIASGLKGGAFVVEKGIELESWQYLLEGWHMVRTNVEKIGRLSLDMLNYAKTATVQCQWCDPNEPVDEIAALMAPRAEEEAIVLDIQLAPDPDPVLFDPDAIHRALLNLVTNAMDACQNKRGAKVGIHASATRDGGICYKIIDNGCGMDARVRQRLFQSFFSTKGDQGTGIGLMMTRSIIDKHGGTIDIHSRKGRGSEFVIHLPAHAPQNTDPPPAQAPLEETL
jgi:signal transduction histidine kinase